MDQAEQVSENRDLAVQRACDYASSTFQAGLTEIENLRNRSLIALGLMSAGAALLATAETVQRLRPVMWIPGTLFIFALAAALPPLMSVSIVHPVKLVRLHKNLDDYTSSQVDEGLLRDTAEADTRGERMAHATAVYTNNALRLATLGLVALAAPVVVTALPATAASLLGVLVGAGMLGLVELGRNAIRLSVEDGTDNR